MKKAFLAGVAVLFLLFSSQMVYAVQPPIEDQVKQELDSYFDLRYKMLSTLTYDPAILTYLAPDILNMPEALTEADVLETIIKYRKNQLNDLRFSQFSYELLYQSFQEANGTVSVSLKEHHILYFNCAPTVKNEATTEHNIILKKYNDKWRIVKDDYSDPEGIKKMLINVLLKEGITKEQAMEHLINQTSLQMTSRSQKLVELIENAEQEEIFVFFAGKPLAYAMGYSGKIEKNGEISPVVKNSAAYLPLRFIIEKTGGQVGWDPDTREIKVEMDNHLLLIKDKEKRIYLRDQAIEGENDFINVEGRILLSAQLVADLLNKKLYQNEDGLILLGDKNFREENNQKLLQDLSDFGRALFSKADFPRIDGSTATYPLSMEIGKELLGLDETGVKGFITHQTTHNAYVNLINGEADIIFVTPPSPDELALANEKGIKLDVIPICKEGFVFLVNEDNPVTSVRSDQIKEIYQGKITNWKQVGGIDSPIIPYQREANSGSQTIMENYIMKGIPMMMPPKEIIIYGMGQLIDRVADYSNAQNALGYSVYYYATQMYQNRNVRLLAIDGVRPDQTSIGSGAYPFTLDYYAVLRQDEPENSNARRLLKWILSTEGQQIVERAGFVKGGQL